MRFSLQPEPRPEHQMHTVSIEEVLALGEGLTDRHPALEHYFSPTKKEQFIKDYLHYLNSELLEARHGNLDQELYLVFVLSFQFVAPLLEIHSEKELGLFYRILQKTYDVNEPDLNLHFTMDHLEEGMIGEEEALLAFRQELEASYEGLREVKESVQKRLKKDALSAIMQWQQDKSLPSLAEAFGRTIVIPSFFSFVNKKLVSYYRRATGDISYEVAVPADFS